MGGFNSLRRATQRFYAGSCGLCKGLGRFATRVCIRILSNIRICGTLLQYRDRLGSVKSCTSRSGALSAADYKQPLPIPSRTPSMLEGRFLNYTKTPSMI